MFLNTLEINEKTVDYATKRIQGTGHAPKINEEDMLLLIRCLMKHRKVYADMESRFL